ncbi:MAG: alkaline phosphatase family protein [Anaerolineae bacterium]|nr:alkaline phosphatase family protein [Anaerolineae bacterium]
MKADRGKQDGLPRVLFIGIDSATWYVMGPLVRAGRLPHFAQLMAEGVAAPLKTFYPTLSPLVWSTISTGKSPEKHGVKSFSALKLPGLRRVLYDYRWEQLSPFSRLLHRALRLSWWKRQLVERGIIKRIPLTSNFRRCKGVWNIASDEGRRAGFIGWWNSWPAEVVDGFWVSQYVELLLSTPPESMDRATYPAEVLDDVVPYLRTDELLTQEEVRRFFNLDGEELESLMTFHHDEFPITSNYTPLQFLKLEYLCHEFRRQVARHLYRTYDPHLLGIFLSVDPAQHFFWHCLEPEYFDQIPDEEIAKYGKTIENWYVYLDEIVGQLVDHCRNGGTVVIVSDHGHGPSGTLPWSGQHDNAPDGILILSGEAIAREAQIKDASVYDITPTILALMGLPIGRDMDGRVLSEALSPAFLRDYPVQYVDTHETRERGNVQSVESSVDDVVMQRLRDLGYVE